MTGAAGFANLGIQTAIGGGTLAAPNGVALGIGDNLLGFGNVNAKLAAGFGSTIVADTGDLVLGDGNSYTGFTSDGELYTGANQVTINDRNEAVLGSLTQLGDGAGGGILTAGTADPADTHNHFLVEEGKNVVGRGEINGHFKNQGHVIGDGTNQAFGGTVTVELGGTTPGFGDGYHDQINDSATVALLGTPLLSIVPWNDFIPAIGDEFEIMTWQAGLSGMFDSVSIDPWFADNGVTLAVFYTNPEGPSAPRAARQ